MNFTIETELEQDGRWIAELINIPGVLVYANTKEQALKKVKILTLRVLADLLEHGELDGKLVNLNFSQN